MVYQRQSLVILWAVLTLFLLLYVIWQDKTCSPSDSESPTKKCKACDQPGQNIVVVFTGRWKFVRINFPYLYRDLKENGGVLDKVQYMMLNYDHETETKLKQLVLRANDLLGTEVFELHYMGYPSGKPPKKYFPVYLEIFSELTKNPCNSYFKMDDDIVYIHPGTFEKMVDSKKSCANMCFMHFGNIVTNWRCSITHERMGLFDNPETNPKSLKFDYDPNGKCGWESSDCADIVLKSFLYYYRNNRLHEYIFDGCEQLAHSERFSIQFFMLDKDLINIPALFESDSIGEDDERWWTQVYSPKQIIKEPNCIVGGAFVVHFSYSITMDEMLSRGYLQDFAAITQKDIGTLLPDELWTLTELKGIES